MGRKEIKFHTLWGVESRRLLPCMMVVTPMGICLGQPSSVTMKEAGHRPPNVILFMVDDMGWQDTSVPFWTRRTPLNDTYETPHMQRLASEGMVFTQAYAAPISSPSRCSLMTGCNAARHRVTNWTLSKDISTDLEDDEVATPEWNVNGICQSGGIAHTFVARSFVDILHDHGYYTIHCGKAHWGAAGTPGEDPRHFGFDVNIAGHAAGGLATYLSERNYGHDKEGCPLSPMHTPGLQKYWGTGIFLTDALTQEAVSALDEAHRAGRPFYLYMSHYAVHIPIDRDPRYYEKYIQKGLSPKEAAYASLIEGMDDSLGKILDWVDRHGETENTVIIFMSDNGGFATSTDWRDAPLYTQNAPLRSGKGSLLEGGIREPMIVRWPSHVAPHSRCDHYVMIEDFYPTILDICDVRAGKVPQTIDGKSFLHFLTHPDTPSKDRALIWNYPNIWGNEGPGISLNCAIRQGDWKLIYNYKTREKELYNIAQDISEQHNLASQHPRLVRQLSRRLGQRLRKMNAQRPVWKTSGKPCLWPDE